jgi:hypothetical protein
MTALQRVHALRQAADQTILQGSSAQGKIMHQYTHNAIKINLQFKGIVTHSRCCIC